LRLLSGPQPYQASNKAFALRRMLALGAVEAIASDGRSLVRALSPRSGWALIARARR
jgi:hypothetical protein